MAGRPRVNINWEVFDSMCFCQATLVEIATYFGLSTRTIERAVQRQQHMKFVTYYEQKRQKGNMSLRCKMWDLAMKGDVTMFIWLSKNHLNFSDKDRHCVDAGMTWAQARNFPLTENGVKLVFLQRMDPYSSKRPFEVGVRWRPAFIVEFDGQRVSRLVDLNQTSFPGNRLWRFSNPSTRSMLFVNLPGLVTLEVPCVRKLPLNGEFS